MESRESNKGIGWLFWGVFLIIAAFVVFYYFAALKAFGEGVWNSLKEYHWIFNALFLLLIAMVISKITAKFIRKQFRHIERVKQLRVDRTRLAITESLLSITIYVIAIIIIVNSIPELKAYSISLLAGVGFMAIVIGFAAQETISNIIAGILIAIYEPFRVGDRIKFGNWVGKVEDVSLRHTVMKTRENQRVVVPNALISKETITNYTLKDEKLLRNIEIQISYDSDIDKAKKIMVSETKKHPDFFDPHAGSSIIEKGEPVRVMLTDFGESSVILRLYFWAKDLPTGFRMSCDLRESIKKRFDREGIEIPFPYRTIVYKKEMKRKSKR